MDLHFPSPRGFSESHTIFYLSNDVMLFVDLFLSFGSEFVDPVLGSLIINELRAFLRLLHALLLGILLKLGERLWLRQRSESRQNRVRRWKSDRVF